MRSVIASTLCLALMLLCAPPAYPSADAHVVVSSVAPPVDFPYNLSWTSYVYNEDRTLEETSIVMVNSTGSAYCYYMHRTYPAPVKVAVETGLSQGIVELVRDALTLDDVFSLDGVYNDAAEAAEFGRDYCELNLTSSAGDEALEFSGYAMLGIMPNTYVSLENVASYLYSTLYPSVIEELSVEVVVQASLSPSGELEAGARCYNNGSNKVSLFSISTSVWHMYIVKRNGCFIEAVPSPNISPTGIVQVPASDYVDFDPQQWNATGLATGEYVVMADLNFLGFRILNVTEESGHANDSPVISWVTLEPEGSDTIVFDATSSCDKEDFRDDLLVRWDWGSDGVWDTSWSNHMTFAHALNESGDYSILVQVMDTDGAISEAGFGRSVGSVVDLLVLGGLVLVIVVVVVILLLYMLVFAKKKREIPK